MENKYYTPTIEEFCEGFQYEKRVNTVGEEVEAYFALDGEIVKIPNYVCTEEDWVRKTFSNNENQEIVELLKEGKIRAKYLDKEDIKSLGFIQLTDDCFYKNLEKYKTYKGILNPEIRILIKDNTTIYLLGENDSKLDLFSGTIKNKHELKRVLTMLGIM